MSQLQGIHYYWESATMLIIYMQHIKGWLGFRKYSLGIDLMEQFYKKHLTEAFSFCSSLSVAESLRKQLWSPAMMECQHFYNSIYRFFFNI